MNNLKLTKMKKINILSLILILSIIWGCTDLEEKPLGLLAPEGFFNTEKDVEAAIFGAYGRMASDPYWGRRLSFCLMYRSDMVSAGHPGIPSQRIQIDNFTNDANNGMVTIFWPRAYDIISAANTAIEGANIIDIDEEKRNALIAEARFARASVYFNLVRLFGDIPYIDAAVTDPEAMTDISKTPEAKVYEGIIDDLEFGKQHLPDYVKYRTRPSKGSAATMLADVYLTLENWDEAYSNAKWVIDNAAMFDYALEADYQDLFNAEKHDGMKEHVFAIDFIGLLGGGGSEGDDVWASMTGIRGSDVQGWGAAVPIMSIYNSFDKDDYRTSVSWDTEKLFGGVMKPYTDFPNEKRPHIAKYSRFMGTSTSGLRYTDFNYWYYRYADVLLMAAEAGCEVNSGPNAELEGYVNQIRARARNAGGVMNTVPEDVTSGLSKEDFIDLVIEERRIELCFEAKRWWDIKRRKLGQEVFKGPNSIEPQPNFQDFHYLLPLPQDELDRNPNLLPQNQGYN